MHTVADCQLKGAGAVADQADLCSNLAEKGQAPLICLVRREVGPDFDGGHGALARKLGIDVPDQILQVGIIACQVAGNGQGGLARRVGGLDNARSCIGPHVVASRRPFPPRGRAQGNCAGEVDRGQKRQHVCGRNSGKVGPLREDQLRGAARHICGSRALRRRANLGARQGSRSRKSVGCTSHLPHIAHVH